MSHEGHDHPQTPQGQQPGQIQINAPDPAVIAAIDAQFRPVPLKLSGDGDDSIAICASHALEVCSDCSVDFAALNQTVRMLKGFPKEMPIPPPPGVMWPPRSTMVSKAKEEGNALFKRGQHAQAVGKYDMAANIAASRFPWEASQTMRDELAVVICNRSAAYFASGDFVAALADADAVIQFKRPWSKGHFRKAKALLGLGLLEDAKESAELGLQFEPESIELSAFIKEIDALVAIRSTS